MKVWLALREEGKRQGQKRKHPYYDKKRNLYFSFRQLFYVHKKSPLFFIIAQLCYFVKGGGYFYTIKFNIQYRTGIVATESIVEPSVYTTEPSVSPS